MVRNRGDEPGPTCKGTAAITEGDKRSTVPMLHVPAAQRTSPCPPSRRGLLNHYWRGFKTARSFALHQLCKSSCRCEGGVRFEAYPCKIIARWRPVVQTGRFYASRALAAPGRFFEPIIAAFQTKSQVRRTTTADTSPINKAVSRDLHIA